MCASIPPEASSATTHELEEAAPGARLERAAAQATAESFLRDTLHADLSRYDFREEEANFTERPDAPRLEFFLGAARIPRQGRALPPDRHAGRRPRQRLRRIPESSRSVEARLRAPAVVQQSFRVYRADSLRVSARRVPLRDYFAGTPRLARMAHGPRARDISHRSVFHHDHESVAAGPRRHTTRTRRTPVFS